MDNDFYWALSLGVVAGMSGIESLRLLLERASAKSAVLQTELSRASELSDEVYMTVLETAEAFAPGYSFAPAIVGGLAGASAFLGLYNLYASRRQ